VPSCKEGLNHRVAKISCKSLGANGGDESYGKYSTRCSRKEPVVVSAEGSRAVFLDARGPIKPDVCVLRLSRTRRRVPAGNPRVGTRYQYDGLQKALTDDPRPKPSPRLRKRARRRTRSRRGSPSLATIQDPSHAQARQLVERSRDGGQPRFARVHRLSRIGHSIRQVSRRRLAPAELIANADLSVGSSPSKMLAAIFRYDGIITRRSEHSRFSGPRLAAEYPKMKTE
jgi:hypothetical protein